MAKKCEESKSYGHLKLNLSSNRLIFYLTSSHTHTHTNIYLYTHIPRSSSTPLSSIPSLSQLNFHDPNHPMCLKRIFIGPCKKSSPKKKNLGMASSDYFFIKILDLKFNRESGGADERGVDDIYIFWSIFKYYSPLFTSLFITIYYFNFYINHCLL